MQKIITRTIFIALATFLCVACASKEPMIFGVPESQWVNLTPIEQAGIIKVYRQHHAENSEDYLIISRR